MSIATTVATGLVGPPDGVIVTVFGIVPQSAAVVVDGKLVEVNTARAYLRMKRAASSICAISCGRPPIATTGRRPFHLIR